MTRSIFDEPAVQPFDEYNQALLAQVHPPDWVNPEPAPLYDLVVIGAGTAGLVVAAGAAGLNLGLKIALIEKSLMGGDCLTLGCVPSKTVIQSSRVAATIRDAARFGIRPPESVEVDFAAVMQRMRRVRAEISPHDSAKEFSQLGIDVFLGRAAFLDQRTVEVNDRRLRFKKAAITTGARAAYPDIPGLVEAGFLTHETVFSLVDRPNRLAVIGGGPIGCEFAQAFGRLGSEVTLIHKNAHLLDREDADAAQIVQERFSQEGINLVLSSAVKRIEQTDAGKVIYYEQQGVIQTVVVDEILIGAGRSPNVEGLNLEAVGVEYNASGVIVDDYLQTTNSRIYAAGDICLKWKFTHAADAAARIVIRNALFAPFGIGRSKFNTLVMPWATYTDPEIAHVGLYETEAQARGINTETIHIPFSDVDRALTDGETDGFVKILLKRGSDQILGATIVANHAGDLISEITLAMVTKQGLKALSQVIHPYPTQAGAIKQAADEHYRKTFLNPTLQFLLKLVAKLS
ncbi:mercuric reductase [Leptolyngbya sp. NIES-2104]|uniref:mercuric reductase n=1 Tax=Leptolyngbya sp. NIES-2104 TaxID=1552121 RepID=UPI0006EC526B|nr:mercuric reductase [Leptolyngbya sp. NIES-2104]GAP98220.1 mercuric ion reductase [Leptolyngbya sp. NIES-2104]